MAEFVAGSVIARLKADLKSFDDAFAKAGRTFAQFKRAIEAQAIKPTLDPRGLADVKCQLGTLRQDLTRAAPGGGGGATAILGISAAQVAREQERLERARIEGQRQADVERLREGSRQGGGLAPLTALPRRIYGSVN